MSERIVRHQDLEVYRKAFEAAMRIFEISKKFPKEETYSLTDQIGVLHVRSAPILPKRGANAVTKPLLLANLVIRKAKPPKRKPGSNLPFAVNIWKKKQAESCSNPATKLSQCWFR